MEWIALITILLRIFGPLLAKLLEKWLDKKLTAAAELLPHPSTYGNEGEARDALFDKAISMTWNPVKKLLLRRLKRHATTMGLSVSNPAPTVPAEVAAEMADFGASEFDE